MATENEHLAVANRTQKTIGHLIPELSINSPWIATAAFYKALHIVEAVFFNDSDIRHTSDHGGREKRLKRIRKYDNISRHYLPLFRASIVARYLSGHKSFDKYLSPNEVVEKLLKHHLHQVEQSAKRFLSNRDSLDSINDCANLP